MNKVGFIFSGVLSIIGIVTLLITKIINLVIPKFGQVAFQVASIGSYSPRSYEIDFSSVDVISITLIIAGIVLGYWFYKKETQLTDEINRK